MWELINRCSPRLGHFLAKPTHTVLRTYYTMLVFWVLLEFSSNGSDPRPGVLSCPLRANTLLIAVVIWMKWHVVMILIVCDLGDGSCFLVIVLVILTQLYSDGYDLSKSSGIIASKSSGIFKPSGSL